MSWFYAGFMAAAGASIWFVMLVIIAVIVFRLLDEMEV